MLRRLVTILLCLSIANAIAASSFAQESLSNIAPNASFENGDGFPSGWMPVVDSGEVTLLWDSNSAHSGNRSVVVTDFRPGDPDAQGEWVTIQFFPIDPTYNYELSVWYKNTISNGGGAFHLDFWRDDTPVFSVGPSLPSSSEWAYGSLTIQPSSFGFNDVNRARLKLIGYSDDLDREGAIWFDDVSVIDVDAPSQPEHQVFIPLAMR